MIGAIIILSLVVVFLLYSHFKKKDLFEKVKWCVSSESLSNMRDHVLRLQYRLDLDEKYRITEDEIDIVVEILRSYQKDLIQKYFNDSLSNYRWTEDSCFVITLGDFLRKHELEKEFNGNVMYTVKDYKSHGTWGLPLFTATYVLTDYAVTYHKLYYITQQHFLKLYKIIGEDKVGVRMAEGIREAIETREIKVGRG